MSTLHQLSTKILSAGRLNEDGVASASIALLEDGKITSHVITNGCEDTETVYQACSISKAIAALAVARLIDEGKLAYETKVVSHLPQLAIDCIVEPKTAHLLENVTVEMLLSHTSGLSRHGFPGYANDVPSLEDILAGRPPANTTKVRFNTFPGAEWSYAGGGYVVLQVFLEHLLDLPFPTIMQQYVLGPLGMSRSRYDDLPKEEHNYAVTHWNGLTRTASEYHRLPESAAAGLWTTPTDLLRAASAIQQSLEATAERPGFLTQATADKMLTSMGTMAFDWPVKGGARGWFVNNVVFDHAGSNDPGFETYLCGFRGGPPELRGKGFAVMTNSAAGFNTAIKPIISALFYLQGWPSWRSLSDQFGKADWVPYAAPEGTLVDPAWTRWIGRWEEGWEIVDFHGPALRYLSFPPMPLTVAATPATPLASGREELILIADGLNRTALRLSWSDSEQVVELLLGRSQVLHRQ